MSGERLWWVADREFGGPLPTRRGGPGRNRNRRDGLTSNGHWRTVGNGGEGGSVDSLLHLVGLPGKVLFDPVCQLPQFLGQRPIALQLAVPGRENA